jgi:hypothetical protein
MLVFRTKKSGEDGVAELCALEEPQVGSGGSAADLSSGHGGRSPTATGGDDPEVDGLSQGGPGVATELGSDHALFHSSADIRKAIYTTNSVEALHRLPGSISLLASIASSLQSNGCAL